MDLAGDRRFRHALAGLPVKRERRLSADGILRITPVSFSHTYGQGKPGCSRTAFGVITHPTKSMKVGAENETNT
jgi:hypothetical protein